MHLGINLKDITPENIKSNMDEYGFVLVHDVVGPELISQLKPELELAISQEAQNYSNEGYKDYGMLIACPLYGGAFLKLVDERSLMKPFDWILGETCIIYVYTSSSMPPFKKNYSSRIHVDRPYYNMDYMDSMGSLICLDAFTKQNGATWVLPGSHKMKEKPDEEYFYTNAIQIEAAPGSVLYFNLRLWHAGGSNSSDAWRHSIGIGMVKPYMKQRIDLPRAMEKVGIDVSGISPFGLQKLGFYSQPPCSLDEYFAPIQDRPYKQASEWK